MRNRIVGKGLLILLFFITPLASWAQDEYDLPCGDENNPFDSPCPLDTGVIAIATIAVLVTVVHLYRKQKKQRTRGVGEK